MVSSAFVWRCYPIKPVWRTASRELIASYVIAEAEDGCRLVFALAELDSGFVDCDVLVADTRTDPLDGSAH